MSIVTTKDEHEILTVEREGTKVTGIGLVQNWSDTYSADELVTKLNDLLTAARDECAKSHLNELDDNAAERSKGIAIGSSREQAIQNFWAEALATVQANARIIKSADTRPAVTKHQDEHHRVTTRWADGIFVDIDIDTEWLEEARAQAIYDALNEAVTDRPLFVPPENDSDYFESKRHRANARQFLLTVTERR